MVLLINLLGYISIGIQHHAQMFPLLAQVAAVHYYSLCPVVEAPHQSSLDMSGVVGVEVEVSVCVRGLSVHGDVQVTTLPPM